MALQKKEADLVAQIAKNYGNVLNLKESPAVLLEILRSYGHVLDNGTGGVGAGGTGTGGTGTGGTGTGGTGGGTSSVAIAGPEGIALHMADLMKAILKVQADVRALGKKLDARAK